MGLVLWGGASAIIHEIRLTEHQSVNFDFNDFATTASTEEVRTRPTFTHSQGALHVALEWRSRPLSRRNPNVRALASLGRSNSGVSADWGMRLGYVRGFQDEAWSVDYGSVSNAPIDQGEYVYLSFIADISYNYRRK